VKTPGVYRQRDGSGHARYSSPIRDSESDVICSINRGDGTQRLSSIPNQQPDVPSHTHYAILHIRAVERRRHVLDLTEAPTARRQDGSQSSR
jgi:hypothetical protein